MVFPVFSSRPTAILLISHFRLLPRRLYNYIYHRARFAKTASTARHIATELDMHRQVHVHAGMPCKFSHYMHACLAPNYPEALSHCCHGHDRLSIKHWRLSAFAEMPSSPVRRSYMSVSDLKHLPPSRENTVNPQCYVGKP